MYRQIATRKFIKIKQTHKKDIFGKFWWTFFPIHCILFYDMFWPLLITIN